MLTPQEKQLLREAIYVARQGANPTLDTALEQLNDEFINVTPDRASEWINRSVIDAAMGRTPQVYTPAWDALLREMGSAPPIGTPNPTPEPTPPSNSYPTTDDGNVVEVRKVGEGGGIRFITDANYTSAQREGSQYDQIVSFEASDDGGGGISQNVVFPGGGKPAYIPDPTRNGFGFRMDRAGNPSMNIYVPDRSKPNADGSCPIKATHKGQLAVFMPQLNGDLILRLPQYGGRLLVEKGFAGHPDHTQSGSSEVASTHEVLLSGDIGVQRS